VKFVADRKKKKFNDPIRKRAKRTHTEKKKRGPSRLRKKIKGSGGKTVVPKEKKKGERTHTIVLTKKKKGKKKGRRSGKRATGL